MHVLSSNTPVLRSTKWVWALVLAVSFTLALAIVAYGWRPAEKQADEKYQSVRTLGRAIATASADLLAVKDYTNPNRILLRTIDGPEILRVQVTDQEGWIRGHVYKPNGLPPQLGIDGIKITVPKSGSKPIEFEETAIPGTEGINGAAKWLTIRYPVEKNGILGWVYVNGSIAQAQSSKTSILRESIMSAVLIIALSVLFGTYISRRQK